MRRKRDWKSKVHAEFIEAARIYKKAAQSLDALGANPKPEDIQKLQAKTDAEFAQLKERFPESSVKTTSESDAVFASPNASPDEGLMQWLHWVRFREPLWLTIQNADEGDIEAQKALNRTILDYQHTRRGDKLSSPKGGYDHLGFFMAGWACGLRELTSEELADCFDELCPCGKVHDADAVKKQRSRIAKGIEKSNAMEESLRAKSRKQE